MYNKKAKSLLLKPVVFTCQSSRPEFINNNTIYIKDVFLFLVDTPKFEIKVQWKCEKKTWKSIYDMALYYLLNQKVVCILNSQNNESVNKWTQIHNSLCKDRRCSTRNKSLTIINFFQLYIKRECYRKRSKNNSSANLSRRRWGSLFRAQWRLTAISRTNHTNGPMTQFAT